MKQPEIAQAAKKGIRAPKKERPGIAGCDAGTDVG